MPTADAWFRPAGAKGLAAAERDWRNRLKLLREGSSADRQRVRREVLAPERWRKLRAAILNDVVSSNQFEQLHAALIIERMGGEAELPALVKAVGPEARGSRLAVALALGRIGGPQAVRALSQSLAHARTGERVAILLALGMTGEADAARRLVAFIESKHPKRELEAAWLALGAIPAGVGGDALRGAADPQRERRHAIRHAAAVALALRGDDLAAAPDLREDDERVRIAGWARLARSGAVDPQSPSLRWVPSGLDERRVRMLAIGRSGDDKRERLILRGAQAPAPEVRCAAMSALRWLPGKRGVAALRAGLKDSRREVVLAALLSLIARSGEDADKLDPTSFAAHSFDKVRDAALLAEVWIAASAGRKPRLERWLGARQNKEQRQMATSMHALAEIDLGEAGDLARLRLQVLLDHQGWSASWAANELAHRLVLQLLNLQDALDQRGTGEAPGRPRPAGGAPRPPPVATAEEQDLRRHLDAWPLFDRRPPASLEFQPLRN